MLGLPIALEFLLLMQLLLLLCLLLSAFFLPLLLLLLEDQGNLFFFFGFRGWDYPGIWPRRSRQSKLLRSGVIDPRPPARYFNPSPGIPNPCN